MSLLLAPPPPPPTTPDLAPFQSLRLGGPSSGPQLSFSPLQSLKFGDACKAERQHFLCVPPSLLGVSPGQEMLLSRSPPTAGGICWTRRLPLGRAASAWGGLPALWPWGSLSVPPSPEPSVAGEATGRKREDGKGGPSTGSTREGTGGVRPLPAALPLFLLSFPLPSPASAFPSQTHRSSPINPPRSSRGTPLASPAGFIPTPASRRTNTYNTGSPWQAGELVPTPAPGSPDLLPPGTARGRSRARGIRACGLGPKPGGSSPWGSRASLRAARRSSTAGSGHC